MATILGDGHQWRSFIFADDVVQANSKAVAAEKLLEEPAINCAYDKRITIKKLIVQLDKIMGKDVNPVFTDPRMGHVSHSFADNSRAVHNLNYKP